MDTEIYSLPERYKIEACLGEGGSSIVLLAIDEFLDKKVAIKYLKEPTTEHLIRIQKEAHTTARLKHKNILPVIDFGLNEKNSPYIVMEYIEGATLKELIAAGEMNNYASMLDIFSQILQGLIYAHEEGVLHRDIKPSNILISRNGDDLSLRAVIADFGLAKNIETNNVATSTKGAIGSPPYMSPEQICGEDIDARADIYSMGCLMFETISGNPPFLEDSAMETMNCHLREPVPELLDINQQEPPEWLVDCIKKCLSKKRVDRFSSAAELKSIIDKNLDEIPLPDDISNESSNNLNEMESKLSSGVILNSSISTKPKKNGKKNVFLLGFIAALIIVGILTLYMFRQSQSHQKNEMHVDLGKHLDRDNLIPNELDSSDLDIHLESAEKLIARALSSGKEKLQLDLSKSDVTGDQLGRLPAERITYLKLDYTHLNDDDLHALIKMRKLETLSLRGCPKLTGRGLEYTAGLPLRGLDLTFARMLEDKNLAYLTGIPTRFTLELSHTKISNKGLALLANCNVSNLILHNMELNEECFKQIAHISTLNSLDLRSTNSATKYNIEYLLALPDLRNLTIAGNDVDAECLETVSRLPKLERLWLPFDRELPIAGLYYLKNLSTLKDLEIQGGSADYHKSSSFYKALSNLRSLEHITLKSPLHLDCWADSDKLPNLKSLSIHGDVPKECGFFNSTVPEDIEIGKLNYSLRANDIKILNNIKNLQKLEIRYFYLPINTMKCIAALPVKELVLISCGLDLGALEQLRQSKTLKELLYRDLDFEHGIKSKESALRNLERSSPKLQLNESE